MYYNNIGGATGVLGDKSGVVLDASGLNIYNTNPAAYRAYSTDFSFAWDSGTDALSWSGTDDLYVEVTDPSSGTLVQALDVAGPPTSVTVANDGDVVYFDLSRTP